jgi:hypothetical protein
MKILWLSRHSPLSCQMDELRSIFGPDTVLSTDIRPFGDAHDIVRRYRSSGAEEMVVVAPLSVLDALCREGIFPLRADMRALPEAPYQEDPTRHVHAAGRWYAHVQFVRVVEMTLRTVNVFPLQPCVGCGKSSMTGEACQSCLDLLDRYREYSEETWCAGFYDPTPYAVQDFRSQPRRREYVPSGNPATQDYELAFLAEYFRQEKGAV